MHVASSGREVPTDITVMAMNFSDRWSLSAMFAAEFTKSLPPPTRAAMPPIIIRTATVVGYCFVGCSCSVSVTFWLSWLNEVQIYHVNIARSRMPSICPRRSSPMPNRLFFIPSIIRSPVTAILSGMSFLRFLLVMTRGVISAVIPRIIMVLNIFDPMTFPMAMSALCWNADMKLTTISGVDVPIPTMVSPMRNSLIPDFLATLEEPSTR